MGAMTRNLSSRLIERKEVTKLDPLTKEYLILFLYDLFDERNIKPSYGEMHRAAKILQDLLEENYNMTMGYKFDTPSLYDIWDNDFQEDLETLEVSIRGVDNRDVLVENTTGYYSHELEPTNHGKSLLKNIGIKELEKYIPNLEAFKEKLEQSIFQ